MSNFNVQKDSWLEVVFEDKNKAYGAYQLRKENDTTTLKALFYAIVLVASGVGLLSFTTPKPKVTPPIDGPTLKPSILYVEPKNELPKEKENFGKENTIKNKTPKPSDVPQIVNTITTKPLMLFPLLSPADKPMPILSNPISLPKIRFPTPSICPKE